MSDKKQLTITLTGRAPVKINREDWPKIAEASDHTYDGEYDFQSFRRTKWYLNVRQHVDGRMIVYSIYSHKMAWQGEQEMYVRAGHLYPTGADLPKAISELAREMVLKVDREGSAQDAGVFYRLGDECIANLPTEELV